MIYDYFNELTEQSFYKIREKLLSSPTSTRQVSALIQNIPRTLSVNSEQSKFRELMERENGRKTSLGSVDSFSTVEIPILIEERMVNVNGETEFNESILNSEATMMTADESTLTFYEDKYVPEYMSARNFVSRSIEFFEDNGNDSMYAKVKL